MVHPLPLALENDTGRCPVQGELRIAKENCRRMEDRMRGVLKERSELVTTIKSLSPGKANISPVEP